MTTISTPVPFVRAADNPASSRALRYYVAAPPSPFSPCRPSNFSPLSFYPSCPAVQWTLAFFHPPGTLPHPGPSTGPACRYSFSPIFLLSLSLLGAAQARLHQTCLASIPHSLHCRHRLHLSARCQLSRPPPQGTSYSLVALARLGEVHP